MKKKYKIYLAISHLFLVGVILYYVLVCHSYHTLKIENNTLIQTSHYKRMVIYHKLMDGNVPDKSVIFIGDSIIQGLAVAAVSPFSVNYGIGADTTNGVLKRLPFYHSLKRAKAVILSVGINDLKRFKNKEIIKNYIAILEILPTEVPIIVSAILPINEKTRNKPGQNQRIIELNKNIQSLLKDFPNTRFINSGALLTDQKGNLLEEYHIGDGLHLNAKGYSLWINELKNALENSNNSRTHS